MKHSKRKILRHSLFVLFCILCAFIAYRSVLLADFIGLQDSQYVSQNQIVQEGLSGANVRWAFQSLYASTWQPLVWISYMMDTSIQGFDPASFHRTNLLLHLINIGLLYLLACKITKNHLAAGITTLLFAIHPVHVESVAWIAERKGLMGLLFALLALLAYLAYTRSEKQKFYLLAAVSMACGLMAHHTLITLPLLFLLLDIWPANRAQTTDDGPPHLLSLFTEKIPFFILAMGSGLVAIYAQYAGDSLIDTATISVWGRISNAAISFWRYLWHMIYPLRLSVLYLHPGRWPIGWTLLAIAALALLGYLLVRFYRKIPYLTWGLAWFTLALLPGLGFLPFNWHAMADRFLYLPAIGLYIALGIALAATAKRYPWSFRICGFILLILMIGQTHRTAQYWHNSTTLFSRAVEVTRNNWVMHNSLGTALTHAGRYDEATEQYEKAIEINPEYAHAKFNLGHIRFVQERWEEAAQLFERSIELERNYQALFNLAVTQSRMGEIQEAKQRYLELLESHPNHIRALLNLARIYHKEGQHAQAMACYRIVLERDPDNQEARTGNAIILFETGDDPMLGVSKLIQLLEEDPNNAEAREALNRAIHGEQQEPTEP